MQLRVNSTDSHNECYTRLSLTVSSITLIGVFSIRESQGFTMQPKRQTV